MQRILTGETLSLDLVNTEWVDHGAAVDFLADETSAELWFRDYGFSPETESLEALLAARRAIRAFLDTPGPASDAALNDIFAHGYKRTIIVDGNPQETAVTDSGWGAAWAAAAAFAELLATQPERVRQCAHPDCVLYFFDTSRNGRRRWHSMETCGARTKSARHYQRQIETDSAKPTSEGEASQ